MRRNRRVNSQSRENEDGIIKNFRLKGPFKGCHLTQCFSKGTGRHPEKKREGVVSVNLGSVYLGTEQVPGNEGKLLGVLLPVRSVGVPEVVKPSRCSSGIFHV